MTPTAAGRFTAATVTAVVLVVAMTGLVAPAKGASPKSAAVAAITLSEAEVTVASTVIVNGNGFPARSSGQLSVGDVVVRSVKTDGKGALSADFTVPSSVSGSVAVKVVVRTAVASAPLTVTSGASTTDRRLLGVTTEAIPWDWSKLDAWSTAVGTRPGLVMIYQGWAYDEFDAQRVQPIADRGAKPMITWEPWDYRAGVNQPAYALDRITAGDHDAYIRRWARGAKSWGQPLMVRFGHEMNAHHYPWSTGVNGNGAGDYVAAWRHVVEIFRAEGASNVSWVWSPNVVYAGTTPLTDLYPGSDYVDWTALDGYNGGSALPWGGWLSAPALFDPSLTELRALAPGKPVLLAEIASVEQGGDKATWITEMFSWLKTRDEVRGLVWFDLDKEADWRVASSTEALEAFKTSAGDAQYQ